MTRRDDHTERRQQEAAKEQPLQHLLELTLALAVLGGWCLGCAPLVDVVASVGV